MIELSTFAANIQAALNTNGQIHFRIFADAGTYKNALVTRTEKASYTNGVLRAGSSTIVPSQGGVIATQSVQLEICIRLPNPETDEEIITAHRAVLDTYFQNSSTQLITDANGKKYSVGAVYSLAGTGTVEQRPGVGSSLTLFVNISYAYVEGGVNSSDCVFTLDGNVIPYTSASIFKNPTAESNTYADGDGKGETCNTAFLHSFSFEMPTLESDPVSLAVVNALLGDELNSAHTLNVKIGSLAEETYTVIFGEATMNAQGVQNPGLKFSLGEAATFTAEGANG